MKTINSNLLRVGNFTSSEIVALTTNGKAKGTFGKPFYTYIEECNMERNLGRSLENESNARPLSWGHLIEGRVFELLGTEYQLVSQETIVHPTINFWAGSPDANKFDQGQTVVDIKAPLTLKSFCRLVAPIYDGLSGLEAINAIRNGFIDSHGHPHPEHPDGDKFFWQLTSNAILTGSKYAELKIYVPYRRELEEIRDLAQRDLSGAAGNVYWIANASDYELPWLKEGGYYKNLNTIRWEVSTEDKDFLTQRVLEAGQFLDNNF